MPSNKDKLNRAVDLHLRSENRNAHVLRDSLICAICKLDRLKVLQSDPPMLNKLFLHQTLIKLCTTPGQKGDFILSDLCCILHFGFPKILTCSQLSLNLSKNLIESQACGGHCSKSRSIPQRLGQPIGLYSIKVC